MAESIRQQIVTAILARMSTITTANNYETDIGNSVHEFRQTDFQESELPAMDVRDVSESVEKRGGNDIFSLSIEIEAKTLGSTSGTQARDIIADISKAVGVDSSFGNLAQDTLAIRNDILSSDKNNRQISSILMAFEVRYITKSNAPYNLA